MGIFDSLYIGNSGLNAAQIQIQTAGNNITNVDSEYYTRQRVVQQAREGMHRVGGDIGLGTSVQQIVRVHDEFTYQRMATSYSNLEYTDYKSGVLKEITQKFPDLADSGIFQDLKDYYAAWNDYASNPSEAAQKTVLLNETRILTNDINTAHKQLEDIRQTVNDQFILAIDEVNDIAAQIAQINAELQRVEVNTTVNANDFRDKRDALELRLSKLINIDSFKEGLSGRTQIDDATIYDMGKNYTLSINGITIIEGSNYHPIVLDTVTSEHGFATPYYVKNDETKIDISERITSGRISAMLDLRGRNLGADGKFTDGLITKYEDNLDAFAKTLVTQTNSIYASAAVESMNSDYLGGVMADTTLQNYDSGIKSGSFTVKIYNTQGEVVAQRDIEINPTTTLNDISRGNSIVNDFNKNLDDNGDNNFNNDIDDYFQAVFQYDGKSDTANISFRPTDKYTSGGYFIAIEDNGTNFAGTLGLSKFLDGQTAASIRPDDLINADSSLIHGGKSPLPGDNSMANEMVNMQSKTYPFNSKNTGERTETISGYYRYLTADIASDTSSVMSQHSTNLAINNTAVQEWQSVSGVNLDEELANLIRFQSSYGAAAKVITTVEQMLNTLLEIKQ